MRRTRPYLAPLGGGSWSRLRSGAAWARRGGPAAGSRRRVARLAVLLLLGARRLPAAGPRQPADDLRPATQRRSISPTQEVADGMCAAAMASRHQRDARVPHLAGQRPAYLYAKTRATRAARAPSTNESAVKFLNDDALVKVAAYYASLEPAPPPAVETAKKAANAPDPLAAGKAAAEACAGCTARTGVSAMPARRAWSAST